MVVAQSTPLALVLIYRIRSWRLILAIFSDLIRQPPPLILFFFLWWVTLPLIINKAVRNQTSVHRAAAKLITRNNIQSKKSDGFRGENHVVGRLLQSYPDEKLALLKMGALVVG